MNQLNFIGYFIIFPIMFLFSMLFWKLIIKSYNVMEVVTDSLSIIGIYYLLISLVFLIFNKVRK